MKRVTSVGIIVYRYVDNIREYLLLHYLDGHWDFPKGKMEKGETKQETGLRELKEETGLEATIDEGFQESFSYIFRDRDKLLTQKTAYFFVGEANNQKVSLSYEHNLYSWLDYDQAHYRLTFDNAKELLEKAEKFLNKLET